MFKTSLPKEIFSKSVLKMCIKFMGEHQDRKVIPAKFLCSPESLVHICRTCFKKNDLNGCFWTWWYLSQSTITCSNLMIDTQERNLKCVQSLTQNYVINMKELRSSKLTSFRCLYLLTLNIFTPISSLFNFEQVKDGWNWLFILWIQLR